MLKNTPAAPVFTAMQPKSCWGLIKTCTELESYLGRTEKWPKALKKIKNQDMEYALMSLGMTVAFLEESLLAELTIPTGEFHIYTPESHQF